MIDGIETKVDLDLDLNSGESIDFCETSTVLRITLIASNEVKDVFSVVEVEVDCLSMSE